MRRTPCCQKDGLKKGPWTAEEDQKLIDYIQKHGHGSWRTLPKNAGLQRCGKSCRLRWTNYLRPDIKRGRFSFEEEETIIQLHSILGNKWSAIAARLPGRTDNEIKNYWNTHIRKRLLRMGIDPVTHAPRLDHLDLSSLLSSSHSNFLQLLRMQHMVNPEVLRLATSLLSSQDENPLSILQTLQQNQLYNAEFQLPLFNQNQLQTSIQETQPWTTSTSPRAPFLDESQLIQPNLDQFQSNYADLNHHNSQPTVCQDSLDTIQNYDPIPSYGFYSNFQSSDSSNLVLSTPSSTPTPLTSSPTHMNSGTEDERDTYCSNVLNFELPDVFDVNEFI